MSGFYVQAQNLPVAVDPAPSLPVTINQAALPAPSQRNAPANLTNRLKEILNLLEKPIEQLVQSVDHLHGILDAVAA